MNTTKNNTLTHLESMLLTEGHKASGRLAEAEAILCQIFATAADYHPAYHMLRLIAYAAGKLPMAVELIVRAISIDEGVALYHRNIGEMCRRLGRLAIITKMYKPPN